MYGLCAPAPLLLTYRDDSFICLLCEDDLFFRSEKQTGPLDGPPPIPARLVLTGCSSSPGTIVIRLQQKCAFSGEVFFSEAGGGRRGRRE